jgi:hypothetical protein
MIYKILLLIVSGSAFSQHYQLDNIECPRWLPGTEQILPAGVVLSPAQELQNKVRCYCEVVKQKEHECLSRRGVPKSICIRRTNEWVERNLSLHQRHYNVNGVLPPPRYDRMLNIEP